MFRKHLYKKKKKEIENNTSMEVAKRALKNLTQPIQDYPNFPNEPTPRIDYNLNHMDHVPYSDGTYLETLKKKIN